jgi:hypothetical protein
VSVYAPGEQRFRLTRPDGEVEGFEQASGLAHQLADHGAVRS